MTWISPPPETGRRWSGGTSGVARSARSSRKLGLDSISAHGHDLQWQRPSRVRAVRPERACPRHYGLVWQLRQIGYTLRAVKEFTPAHAETARPRANNSYQIIGSLTLGRW